LPRTARSKCRIAETEYEIEAAQRLRYRVFYEEMSAIPTPQMRGQRRDFDKYDAFCDHMLVVDNAALDANGEPAVVGCYRLLRGEVAACHGGYYTSSEYDLTPMLKAIRPARDTSSSGAPACSRATAPRRSRCSSYGAASSSILTAMRSM
jgi:putative hemolysin